MSLDDYRRQQDLLFKNLGYLFHTVVRTTKLSIDLQPRTSCRTQARWLGRTLKNGRALR